MSQPFRVSQAAINAIERQIAKRSVPGTSLRVGVRGGGCSGFSYVIEFCDEDPNTRDTVYDLVATNAGLVRVFIDAKSLVYLSDSTLEWEETLMRQGFRFVNPNVTSTCGCGESFTLG